MRSRNESDENPPNTTECAAPMRAHASNDIGSSGTMPEVDVDAVALLHPSAFNAFASCDTSSSSWRYVIVRPGPVSASQKYATLSPWPSST